MRMNMLVFVIPKVPIHTSKLGTQSCIHIFHSHLAIILHIPLPRLPPLHLPHSALPASECPIQCGQDKALMSCPASGRPPHTPKFVAAGADSGAPDRVDDPPPCDVGASTACCFIMPSFQLQPSVRLLSVAMNVDLMLDSGVGQNVK